MWAALAGALVLPTQARADECEPCPSATGVVELTPASVEIAFDGVVAVSPTWATDQPPPLDAVLSLFSVEVSDSEGQRVDGALEHALGWVVFRPTKPLEVDTALRVDVTVDNAGIAADETCVVDDMSASFELTVSDASVLEVDPPIDSVELSATRLLTPDPYPGLDDVVCCDSAFPVGEYDACLDRWTLTWETGDCQPLLASASVQLSAALAYEIDAAPGLVGDLLPVLAYGEQAVAAGLPGDAALQVSVETVDCATLRLFSFATGHWHLGATACVEPSDAGVLGPQQYASVELMAELCVGQPYTCSSVNERWVGEACQPWPGDEPGGSDDGEDDGQDDGGPVDDGEDDLGEDDDVGTIGGCSSPDEHDHDDDDAVGCAYCGQGAGRPPWLAMLLLLAARPRRRRTWTRETR